MQRSVDPAEHSVRVAAGIGREPQHEVDRLLRRVAAGFVERAVPLQDVRTAAVERAASLAHLGANRANYAWQKQVLYGENAILNSPHGAAHLLSNSEQFISGRHG